MTILGVDRVVAWQMHSTRYRKENRVLRRVLTQAAARMGQSHRGFSKEQRMSDLSSDNETYGKFKASDK